MGNLNAHTKLSAIQLELKAPKNQVNKFGNFNFRSAEDILESLKPLLGKYKATIIISDKIVFLEGRFYVEGTATFTDIETGEQVIATGYAREEDSKRGMDGSQVTGAASSYARKYALNGLFGIDDNKDSDVTNNGKNKKNDDNPELKEAIEKIKNQATSLLNKGVDKSKVSSAIKSEFTSANYNQIKDVSTAKKVLEALKKV